MRRPLRLLLDFGFVLTGPQNPAVFDPFLAEVGLRREAFLAAWALRRRDYDAGTLDAPAYWGLTLAACGLPGAQALAAARCEELVELDLLAWLVKREALHAYLQSLLDQGAELGILSNMPPGIGERYVAAWPWLARIPFRLFSGDEGLAKPDPAFFRFFLERSGWNAGETLFVDDVAANVEAAAALGFAVYRFEEEAAALAAIRAWAAGA